MRREEIEHERRILMATPIHLRGPLIEADIARVETELPGLEEKERGARHEYVEWRSAMRPDEKLDNVEVVRLPEDEAGRRWFTVGGIVAGAMEGGLASWIFHLRGVHWVIGLITAIALTWIAEVGFTAVYDVVKTRLPKETLRRINRGVVTTFAVLGVVAAIALIARYIEIPLVPVDVLLTVLSLSLWVGTLTLVLLAAHFFCAAKVYAGSGQRLGQYEAARGDVQANRMFLDDLRRMKKDNDSQ